MSESNSFNIGADNLILGSATGTVNISSLGGEDILINGVSPGGSGAVTFPINGTGDITAAGNITATGDGITTGKVEGVYVRSSDNILAVGTITGNILKSDTNIYIPDTNTIIRNGTGGNLGTETEYCISQGVALKATTNTFTQIQSFSSNVLLTGANAILHVEDGSLKSKSANVDTGISCESIIVGNGVAANNSIKTRSLNFRPTGLNGWDIRQDEASATPVPTDNFLQIMGGQPASLIHIVDSAFDPAVSTIVGITLDPLGTVSSKISVDTPIINFRQNATDAWSILQPPVGDPAAAVLQVKSLSTLGAFNITDSSSNIWAGFTSTATTINKATSVNNTIMVTGAATLTNTLGVAGDVGIASDLNLSSSSFINFGSYSFAPKQYTHAFTGGVIDDNPATIFNNASTIWTNTNDGTTSTVLSTTAGEGMYMLTIDGSASSGGTYGKFKYMINFPFVLPNFSVGTIFNQSTGSFRGETFLAGFTTPNLCSFSITSSDFKLCFPSVTSGTETYSGTITLTKLPY